MSPRVRIIVLTFVGLILPLSAAAQWTEQTIHLEPGWNAVFFEVDPHPRDCDSVFQGLPVESVWWWNKGFAPMQFIPNPETLSPDQPEWLTYFPASSPRAILTNLHLVRGDDVYLINLGGVQPVDWVLRGRPCLRPRKWIANSFNLVGFHIDESAPPTFATFFAPSKAHAGQKVFRLAAGGDWKPVVDPATETIRHGEAYWIYCKGQSDYEGPLSIVFGGGTALEFGRILVEQEIRLRNHSAAPRTATIAVKPSLPPPTPELPALAGNVPLSRFEKDIPNLKYGWTALSGPLSLEIPPNEERRVELAVRRPDMVKFTPPAGRAALYQSLLEIRDDAGSRFLLPVGAKGLRAPRVEVPAAAAGGGSPGNLAHKFQAPSPDREEYTGLWVGYATIRGVSNPTSGALEPTRPRAVGEPISFRLIVHVDESGTATLLQQVIQMWKEGQLIPNPEDPTGSTFIVDPSNPGHPVLLTSESLIEQYSGVALRDTDLVGRRISSAVFGFPGTIDLTGGVFGTSGDTLGCEVVLDYRDPLNPFLHRYHPDHDNLDARYEETYPEGKESYTITRTLSLEFTAEDPDDLVSAGAGDDLLFGIYRETIAGAHRSPIYVQGTFRLSMISDVGVLNDGQ